MKWAYGITTVPDREFNYLPKTLESLKQAGFTTPHLFVDGPAKGFKHYDLPISFRGSRINAYGNWIMSLLELWIRYPNFDRYALFQDDFVTYRNLREYLETINLLEGTYWNLLTFPAEEEVKPSPDYQGWYFSKQRGRGAVALVFPHITVHKLLSSEQIMAKPQLVKNSTRNIDGCLVESANVIGIRELVHYPTLVWHIGDSSSLGNFQHKKPSSFKGQDFDARDLIGASTYGR